MGGGQEVARGRGRGGKKGKRVGFDHPDIAEEEEGRDAALAEQYEIYPPTLALESLGEEEDGEEEDGEEGGTEGEKDSWMLLRDRSMSLPFGSLRLARSPNERWEEEGLIEIN